MFTLAVIGAGPAGVSAALYARSRGLDVTVFEADAPGGLIGKVSKVSHFASAVEGESGPEFAERLKTQLDAADIPVIYSKVDKIEKDGDLFRIKTANGRYEAEGVILATGSTPKELPVTLPIDAKVSHFALGKEKAVRDHVVVMNGGSDGAVKEALYLAQFAREVHIVQNQPELMCIAQFREAIEAEDNVIVHTGATLKNVKSDGKGKITAVYLDDENNTEIFAEDGIEVFALIGQNGNGSPLSSVLPVEENGYIRQDGVGTSVKGLWTAGDVRVKAVRQVATAVSDGCLAGIEAAKVLGR